MLIHNLHIPLISKALQLQYREIAPRLFPLLYLHRSSEIYEFGSTYTAGCLPLVRPSEPKCFNASGQPVRDFKYETSILRLVYLSIGRAHIPTYNATLHCFRMGTIQQEIQLLPVCQFASLPVYIPALPTTLA